MKSRKDYRFPFSRYPALRLAFLFCVGIILERHLFTGIQLLVFSMVLLLIYSVSEVLNRKSEHIQLNRFTIFSYLILVIVAGYARSSVRQNYVQLTPAYLKALEWENVELSGKVQAVRKSASGKYRITLLADTLITDGIKFTEDTRVVFSLDVETPLPLPGQKTRVYGSVLPQREKRNPHDFDQIAYLYSQNISFQMTADSINVIQMQGTNRGWIYWRRHALSVIDTNFDSNTSSIAKAMILGYKDDLAREDRTAFARVGLSHIMAVSGLHVGFIIAPFWLVIPWFWSSFNGKTVGLIILITILFLYAGITGFSASVLRASIMAGLLTYARLFHKNSNSINLMGAAALVILMIDPEQLFNVGFQLSFSAVMVILTVLPVIQQRLPYELQTRWYAKPFMVMIVSLVVQFGLYPLQAYYFGEVSLISPLANALFVPLLGLFVPLAILAVIVGGFFPDAGVLLNYPVLFFLKGMHSFVDLSSDWEWVWFSSSGASVLLFFLWISMILFVSSIEIAGLRWKWLIICLLLINLDAVSGIRQKLMKPEMKVLFFDVGQGDAALLTTPGGKQVLIDSGVWSPGYNSGRSVILPHLKAEGIEKLDAVILSHPHADHIGGVSDLIREIPVKRIINSGFIYDSELYRNYLSLAGKNEIPVSQVVEGDTISVDPSVLIGVLGPTPEVLADDPNQHSVVLKIIYGKTSFLFTGDAGEMQEEHLTTKYDTLLHSEVLKVGHHGSRTSSSSAFLKKVMPNYSVISLGADNKFRHPHNEALLNLYQVSDTVWNTARDRAVELISDGKEIKRRIWY
ncbi:DNA internalization-related competence protein ComEC/Rec2 [Balneola sp. MJW-20]|uniref:DNA internalization-related competence protein ComEC/Rec2 n=1 Tax=Gracilimonas aurantiaca TaxID=3234185 RepID=UPI003467C150